MHDMFFYMLSIIMSDTPKKVGWLDVFKSTMMSFLGVQREEARQRDFEHGKPMHFIIMGIALTIALVLVLVGIVQLILHFAGV